MADFPGILRQWRNQRRVSQLELAVRAGTTQRYVSFVESGRSTPGRGMVVRLAEALQVPLRERNAMLLAAGFAPAYAQGGPALEAARTALRHVLRGHLPYPAIVVDRDGDLFEANAAFHTMVAGVAAELLAPPISVARLFLHPGGLAPRIGNFGQWAWHVIGGLEAELARTPSARLAEVTAELRAGLPAMPEPDREFQGFAVPLRLDTDLGEARLVTTLAHFGTAADVAVAELRLEAFLPADEKTGELLAKLAAR